MELHIIMVKNKREDEISVMTRSTKYAVIPVASEQYWWE
jgi:hypothetical protein